MSCWWLEIVFLIEEAFSEFPSAIQTTGKTFCWRRLFAPTLSWSGCAKQGRFAEKFHA
jgi:hypothetical protein